MCVALHICSMPGCPGTCSQGQFIMLCPVFFHFHVYWLSVHMVTVFCKASTFALIAQEAGARAGAASCALPMLVVCLEAPSLKPFHYACKNAGACSLASHTAAPSCSEMHACHVTSHMHMPNDLCSYSSSSPNPFLRSVR